MGEDVKKKRVETEAKVRALIERLQEETNYDRKFKVNLKAVQKTDEAIEAIDELLRTFRAWGALEYGLRTAFELSGCQDANICALLKTMQTFEQGEEIDPVYLDAFMTPGLVETYLQTIGGTA